MYEWMLFACFSSNNEDCQQQDGITCCPRFIHGLGAKKEKRIDAKRQKEEGRLRSSPLFLSYDNKCLSNYVANKLYV
jgi:hypothetical protein